MGLQLEEILVLNPEAMMKIQYWSILIQFYLYYPSSPADEEQFMEVSRHTIQCNNTICLFKLG